MAAFGRILRGAPLDGDLSYQALLELAQDAAYAADDPRKTEFLRLVEQAQHLSGRPGVDGQPPAHVDLDLTLLRIREAGSGRYLAQIETNKRTGWYREGDAFESFQLVRIDPVRNCVRVFSESLGRSVEMCLDGAVRVDHGRR